MLGYKTRLTFLHVFIQSVPFLGVEMLEGVALVQPQLAECDSVSPSLSHPHASICKEKERERETATSQMYKHTHTHTLTDTARHAWCKGEEILSPCGAPIRTPSPASFPLLRTRSICSALINQGSGGQGVATWNKAWSSHGVRRTTSWHSAKLFLSCGLTRPPSRLHRLLVFFPLAPCVTRPARRHLSGDVTLWPGGKDEGC